MSFWQGIKDEIRHKRTIFLVRSVLILTIAFVAVRSISLKRYEHVLPCVLTIVLFFVPTMISKKWKIEYPTSLEVVILIFIYAAEILGEISCFYVKIPFWDTLLHTTSGFLFAAIGFAFVDLLNRDPSVKFTLSPLFLALFAFCFAITIGTIWEFFECFMDLVFHQDMQKDTVVHFLYSVSLDQSMSNEPIGIEKIKDVILVLEDGEKKLDLGGYLDIGLYDTMEDMFVNLIGAVVFSILGYAFVSKKGEGKIAQQFIPTIEEEI